MNKKPATSAALIVAAGAGSRVGAEIPKQYLEIGGQTALRRTVQAFLRHPAIGHVQVVINPDHADWYAQAVGDLNLPAPVPGGETRQESVLNGLNALEPFSPASVLIHDAARPFVTTQTINNVLEALLEHPGAIPVVAVHDSLKQWDGRAMSGADRSRFLQAQTPQGFRFADILKAHRDAMGLDFTDDAAVAEHAGLAVLPVEGDETNFKITTKEDLMRAQMVFASEVEWHAITGFGFDVHKFSDTPGPIRLCGIDIEHPRGLEGHSDADVGLHAAVDALLGAIADGDIGTHFPPSDPQWKGRNSAEFIAHAAIRVKQKQGRILHLDVTVIGEAPKVSPHREAMRRKLAELLELSPAQVSVKATTTERLGFTGRGEGIAAQAVATVLRPMPKENGERA